MEWIQMLIVLLILYTHRKNLLRLLQGEELKTDSKKDKK